ncbi:uncharacterized protein APUU_50717A [Aspergillus puulaauensis]|uniref:Uncharacterized protein n=1 Tax=Aspergillus puulaauensis TaxID=1220207 RepID=A0A7R8AP27_9EURO|nr:uncharacterized protein APUU_50717A [Aspergillus puulaauensis]BCS26006.1 hypothetical protein APUU_50717A [Aspergillus puulaauensis]
MKKEEPKAKAEMMKDQWFFVFLCSTRKSRIVSCANTPSHFLIPPEFPLFPVATWLFLTLTSLLSSLPSCPIWLPSSPQFRPLPLFSSSILALIFVHRGTGMLQRAR